MVIQNLSVVLFLFIILGNIRDAVFHSFSKGSHFLRSPRSWEEFLLHLSGSNPAAEYQAPRLSRRSFPSTIICCDTSEQTCHRISLASHTCTYTAEIRREENYEKSLNSRFV